MPCSTVLANEGPRLLLDIELAVINKREDLLEVLVLARHQRASDPKDKFFGILGILPAHIQKDFRADYTMSVKDIFTGIVDYLIKTTKSLDVICEAFNTSKDNANGLPSFVPDWSRLPIRSFCSTRDMGNDSYYDAALGTKAECRFLDEKLSVLEISAVYISKVATRGMCGATGVMDSKDFLAIFLQWRAILLDVTKAWSEESRYRVEVDFAQTLCLGEVGVPNKWRHDSEEWLLVCYKAFLSGLQLCLPNIIIDEGLRQFEDSNTALSHQDWSQIVRQVLEYMKGRSFFMTEDGHIGTGSGEMMDSDIVVAALGCRTPIILRPHGSRGNYHFIGDAYLHGYMDGRAIKQLNKGHRELKTYVLT